MQKCPLLKALNTSKTGQQMLQHHNIQNECSQHATMIALQAVACYCLYSCYLSYSYRLTEVNSGSSLQSSMGSCMQIMYSTVTSHLISVSAFEFRNLIDTQGLTISLVHVSQHLYTDHVEWSSNTHIVQSVIHAIINYDSILSSFGEDNLITDMHVRHVVWSNDIHVSP